MAGGVDNQLTLPGIGSYCRQVVLGSIPKLFVMAFAIVIAAYHSELEYVAAEDQPLVCRFVDPDNENYHGYRICINSMAAAIMSILICVILLIIDLLVPCLPSNYVRLAQLFSMIWSIVMAVYYLITSSLIAKLLHRYCDYFGDCSGIDLKFSVFPVFGFFTMIAWVVMAVIALIRLIIGR